MNGSTATYGAAWTNGLPAAATRGGDWQDGAAAGAFALNLGNGPTNSPRQDGARCCIGGR